LKYLNNLDNKKIFDTDGKGYVSNLDMIEGMKDLGVPTP
jgi:hypothetical protein